MTEDEEREAVASIFHSDRRMLQMGWEANNMELGRKTGRKGGSGSNIHNKTSVLFLRPTILPFLQHDEAARCLKNINKCMNETCCPCSTPGEAVGKREDNGGGLESAPKRLRHGPCQVSANRDLCMRSPWVEIRSHKATDSDSEALRTSHVTLLHLDTERLSDTDE